MADAQMKSLGNCDMFPSGWWIPTAIGIGLFLAAFGGFFLAVGYWIWG